MHALIHFFKAKSDYVTTVTPVTETKLNNQIMAEEVGFEPTVGVNPRRFSRPVHSTTLPLLRHPFSYRKIFDS